ncbi:DUF4442 domain-containing protein [Actinokineospora sp. UTMC 2448]|uniref:DUF4442 domain-containing protein n=1 Tax=Actinokineospora sp. UTMC 2448 TaxID=2268449 RepID=UPI002164945A|nr:DUF4442 domain-containing protein [Actinokineospora sp. UTMC 2448]UVS76628.1 hypothetical protein Actkin_00322 [Actinokineospora sp. UTMC 2448]
MSEYDWVAETISATVPWVKTASVTFESVTPSRVVCSLPDRPDQRNHAGGPHAAVMFGLAETASGAVALAAFAAEMGRATPLVVRSEIRYRKLALGALTAEAVPSREVAEVLAELDAGTRPELPVECVIRNADGVTTAEMTVVWTLKAVRS